MLPTQDSSLVLLLTHCTAYQILLHGSSEEMKMVLKNLTELSRDEQLQEQALTDLVNEVAYYLDRDGLLKEGRAEGRIEGLEQGKIQGLEQGKIEGLEQGKIEGREQGLEQGKIEVALNMLRKNSELSFITEVTGLSEDEINKLRG